MPFEALLRYRLFIQLREFVPVDMAPGDYQIRLSFVFPSSLPIGSAEWDTAHPSCSGVEMEYVTPQDSGVMTRCMQVRRNWAKVKLHQACMRSVRCQKRVDKDTNEVVKMQVELWRNNIEEHPRENWQLMSKRNLAISVWASETVHCSLPIFFDPPSLSALSIAIHASRISIDLAGIRKPSKGISDGIRAYHSHTCRPILALIHSLQNFLRQHSQLITSPLVMTEINPQAEELRLRKELEVSSDAWQQLTEQLAILSKKLEKLFDTVIHLVACSDEVAEAMLSEYSLRRDEDLLRNGFIYSEESVESLLHTGSAPGKGPSLLEAMRRNPLFTQNRPLPVAVEGDNSDRSYIVEQRFVSLRMAMGEKLLEAGTMASSSTKSLNMGLCTEETLGQLGPDSLGRKNSLILADGISTHSKEIFKRHLQRKFSYYCQFYADQATHLRDDFTWFSKYSAPRLERMLQKRERSTRDCHLIVFVHGLQGGSLDLLGWRTRLQLLLPDSNLCFLLSEANQLEAWSELGCMAENLIEEILAFTRDGMPARISVIAHSLGGLVARYAWTLDAAKPLVNRLHTLLTLNTPHVGLKCAQRAANWGISLIQWFKQSVCLEQLMLRDAPSDIRETFLYRLSQNDSMGLFKHILLVGSINDLYVPCHSALLEHSKTTLRETTTSEGCYYNEILSNINESVVASKRHSTLVKYSVMHACSSNTPGLRRVAGRAAHIAVLDDDAFIEKFLHAARRYFD